MRTFATSALAALSIAFCSEAHADGDRYLAFEASSGFGAEVRHTEAALIYMPGTVHVSFGKPQFITGAFGAQLSKYFAAGLEVTYATASTRRYDFRTHIDTGDGESLDYRQSGNVIGHVDQGLLFLTGSASYPLGRFAPVVSAGVGVAITNVSQLMLDGPSDAQDIPLYEDGGYSFAYQFGGGFDFWVLKSVALTARYVYTNTNHPSFRSYSASVNHEHLALGIKFLF